MKLICTNFKLQYLNIIYFTTIWILKIAVDTQGPDIFSRVSTTSKKMLLDGQPKSFLKKNLCNRRWGYKALCPSAWRKPDKEGVCVERRLGFQLHSSGLSLLCKGRSNSAFIIVRFCICKLHTVVLPRREGDGELKWILKKICCLHLQVPRLHVCATTSVCRWCSWTQDFTWASQKLYPLCYIPVPPVLTFLNYIIPATGAHICFW